MCMYIGKKLHKIHHKILKIQDLLKKTQKTHKYIIHKLCSGIYILYLLLTWVLAGDNLHLDKISA